MSEKREALAAFHRSQVIEAAKVLFLEKGVEATTMDEIAKGAGYSKSTVYVYFASKEEIYDHIVCQSMVLLKLKIERSVSAVEGFVDRFFSCCRAVKCFYEEYPLFFESLTGEIAVSEEAFLKEPVLREIYRVGEEINGILERLLNGGREEGVLRGGVDPLPAAFLLWAGLCGIIRMAYAKEAYYTRRMGLSREAFLETGFSMLLQSLRA